MEDVARLNIRIESTDPSVIQAVETTLGDIGSTRLEQHREVDAVTILTVMATTVALTKNLVELWKELRSRRDVPSVSVEAASGEYLNLAEVQSEDDIRKFVEGQSA